VVNNKNHRLALQAQLLEPASSYYIARLATLKFADFGFELGGMIMC